MILLWAFIVVLLDQITKFFIENGWQLFESRAVIENVFHLTLVKNTGAAFGILQDKSWIFIIVTLLLFVFIFYFRHLFPQKTWWHKVALGFLIGGALGNFIDRVFRGYVIDFLDFQFWPVFNVADAAITVAIILYFYQLFLDWRAERYER